MCRHMLPDLDLLVTVAYIQNPDAILDICQKMQDYSFFKGMFCTILQVINPKETLLTTIYLKYGNW